MSRTSQDCQKVFDWNYCSSLQPFERKVNTPLLAKPLLVAAETGFSLPLDIVQLLYYYKRMQTIHVRFPEKEIHKAIVAAAKKNRRSMNAEILRAIEFYLKNAPEAQAEEPIKKSKEKDPT
jgi:hypothetical protein